MYPNYPTGSVPPPYGLGPPPDQCGYGAPPPPGSVASQTPYPTSSYLPQPGYPGLGYPPAQSSYPTVPQAGYPQYGFPSPQLGIPQPEIPQPGFPHQPAYGIEPGSAAQLPYPVDYASSLPGGRIHLLLQGLPKSVVQMEY